MCQKLFTLYLLQTEPQRNGNPSCAFLHTNTTVQNGTTNIFHEILHKILWWSLARTLALFLSITSQPHRERNPDTMWESKRSCEFFINGFHLRCSEGLSGDAHVTIFLFRFHFDESWSPFFSTRCFFFHLKSPLQVFWFPRTACRHFLFATFIAFIFPCA